MTFARLVSLVLVVGVAGVSSSFAVCVSACTDDAPTAGAHACHEQAGGISIAAADGACLHGPTILQQGDITRDDRAPLSVAQPTGSSALQRLRALASSPRVPLPPSARPVVSPPILRI